MHKQHKISKQELAILYNYANNSCMYCGISEAKAKELYRQKLHKDHAVNEGSNKIDNCILACKSCNSSKHKMNWDEWYIPENPIYNIERYNKIRNWLNNWEKYIHK